MTDPKFKKQMAVLLSGLIIFFLILLMPQPDGMTVSGQRLLAVVILMAIWWMGEGTSITVTALLPLVLFPALGILSSKEVAPNYTNHLVFLFWVGRRGGAEPMWTGVHDRVVAIYPQDPDIVSGE